MPVRLFFQVYAYSMLTIASVLGLVYLFLSVPFVTVAGIFLLTLYGVAALCIALVDPSR